ncbi:MAG: toprim domain-containing protein [Methanocella sp.]
MSTREKERYEKLQELLAKLSDEAAKVCLVLVEGKKDAHALAELGICGHILAVKAGGKSSFDVLQQIEAMHPSEVILLLDYDRRGQECTRWFQRELERLKIKVNVRFWIELHALAGHEVQCIEGLPAYLVTLQQKT